MLLNGMKTLSVLKECIYYENEKFCTKALFEFLSAASDRSSPTKQEMSSNIARTFELQLIQKDVLDIKAKVGTKAFLSRGFEDKFQLYNMNIHHSPNWNHTILRRCLQLTQLRRSWSMLI